MKIIQSNSKAFSIIELIFVITILGILATLGFQKNLFKETRCTAYLASSLANFQNEISLYFTNSYLSHKNISFEDIEILFQKYTTKNTPFCSLTLNQKNLSITATNNNLKTTLNITPKDLSTNLKIQCPFSNILCKKIHYRYSSK